MQSQFGSLQSQIQRHGRRVLTDIQDYDYGGSNPKHDPRRKPGNGHSRWAVTLQIQGQDKLPVTHDAAATGTVSHWVREAEWIVLAAVLIQGLVVESLKAVQLSYSDKLTTSMSVCSVAFLLESRRNGLFNPHAGSKIRYRFRWQYRCKVSRSTSTHYSFSLASLCCACAPTLFARDGSVWRHRHRFRKDIPTLGLPDLKNRPNLFRVACWM